MCERERERRGRGREERKEEGREGEGWWGESLQSTELRDSYMPGKYTIVNPYLSTLLLKLSVSDSPPLQEDGLLGVIILCGFSLARGNLLPANVQITLVL